MNKCNIVTREYFSTHFITPMQMSIGHRVYWNGKDALNNNLRILKKNEHGICYTSKDNSSIVLRYKKSKPLSMLSTLIHEYAHALLHSYRDLDEVLHPCVEEYEAETVCKNVLAFFDIQSKQVNESVDFYLKQCKNLNLLHEIKSNREFFTMQACNMIIDALHGKEKVIKKIYQIENNNFNYKVECPVCLNKWYFREKSIFIKEIMNYHCPHCGEDKTSGKLMVHTLEEKDKSVSCI